MSAQPHQYIERETARVVNENLFADRLIQYIYSAVREKSTFLFNAVTSERITRILGFINYDLPLGASMTGGRRLIQTLGIDLDECLAPLEKLNTPRKIFERQIKYWETRPMSTSPDRVVAPADAKMLAGSLAQDTLLFLKEKFFHFTELLGNDRVNWHRTFIDGDYAIFRLTPENYHYNHVPVTGRVVDFYQIPGGCHSCNPGAVVSVVTPFSKNKRVVTILDTDIAAGSRVGHVAMIEIAALMIGDIVQCYSAERYDNPRPVQPGMVLHKGQPKSLYRPGSSVDVLLFEKNKVAFADDILVNLKRRDIASRFSRNFQVPLVETAVKVRSPIALRKT
jgi:phosphatidylserine decarboxylase